MKQFRYNHNINSSMANRLRVLEEVKELLQDPDRNGELLIEEYSQFVYGQGCQVSVSEKVFIKDVDYMMDELYMLLLDSDEFAYC